MSLSEDRKKTQGGALLGEGVYGCAFSPPLKCRGKPIATKNIVERRVGKVTTDFDAYWESRITEYLKANPLAANYFILTEEICQPDVRSAQTEPELAECSAITGKRLTSYKQISMAFGGKALSMSSFRVDRFDFFAFTKHLLEGGALLLLSGVIHTDLHSGNVLLDEYQVPRLIDFGMAVLPNQLTKDLIPFVAHQPDFQYNQEPPEFSLLWAKYAGVEDEDTPTEIIQQKKIFKDIQTVVGTTQQKAATDLEIFQQSSRSLGENDPVAFFKTYWPQYDAWSIGVLLISLVRGFMFFKEFEANKSYSKHKVVLEKVMKGLTEASPTKRLDAIEALSVLMSGGDGDDDASESFVLSEYASEWLRERQHQRQSL